MELVFIWVKKIRNLENLSFNFSNQFIFSFNADKLTLSEEPNTEVSIDNFFGEAITNLTAIVGQNAVGKSTFFYLLRHVSNDLKVSFLEDKVKKDKILSDFSYVALYKIGKSFYYFTNAIDNKIKCNYPALTRRQQKEVDNFNCFYYANFFDYSSNYYFSHTFDVSTSAIVNDIYNQIREDAIENEDHIYEANLLYSYKTNEILSQIKFVSEFDKRIPFQLPSIFAIKPNLKSHPAEDDFPDEEEDDDSKYYQIVKLIDKIKSKYNGEVKEKYSDNEVKEYIKRKIQQAVLVNYLNDNVFLPTNVVGHYEPNFDITENYTLKKISATKNLDRLFVDLIDMIPVTDEDNRGKQLLDWINSLIEIVDVKKHINIKEATIYVNLQDIDEEGLRKLIKSLSKMEGLPPFLDFYWEGISSGENALITIFSRFYGYRGRFGSRNSSILLIFDECEINFHPAWQRKLIFYLTTIFPLIFANAKLQLFISSHSPLILSDIPKSNIIFLKKDENNQVTISHLTDKKQTFAANIHTLLSDAFFMDEGTIGELAKNKINWLIDSINKRYSNFEECLTLIENLVEIIGEPVIKSKLISLINDKHSLNFYNFNERIKAIEKKKK